MTMPSARLLYMVLPALLLSLALASNPQPGTVGEIGHGKAIIFSPDLVVDGNREFYERLGFLYFDSPDWDSVLDAIRRSPRPIDTVILETHGTNGTGLKLQEGKKPSDARSYISVGALQERLASAGVPYAVISACNAGRLFRPEIYTKLDPDPAEPLFLPATLGIVHASGEFDASKSGVRVYRRKQSNLETLMEGRYAELSEQVRSTLDASEGEKFVVSSMLVQLLLNDPDLELVAEGFATSVSRADLSLAEREALFQEFVSYVNGVRERELITANRGEERKGQARILSLVPGD